jgi:hypothetical protein
MTGVTHLSTLDDELLGRARRRRGRNGSAVDPWDVASETRRPGRLPSGQIGKSAVVTAQPALGIRRLAQRGFQED